MLPDEISDDENLYRAIHPNFIKEVDGVKKITSALFKDSNGNSVDREGDRTSEESIDFFRKKDEFSGFGLSRILTLLCRESGVEVVYDPIKLNKYHSLIIRNKANYKLTSGQARKLKRKCEILYFS